MGEEYPPTVVMLNKVDRDIWIVDGPTIRFLGFPYPTRMVVVRLAGGSLWVWSPIPLSAALVDAINSLGSVRCLVSPNKLHHLFLAEWSRIWPDAKLYASPGLVRRRRDLTFSAELGDEPDPVWAADIDHVIFHGSVAMEEVVFFHRASRSAIVADLVQKFDPASLHGWRGAIMRLDGIVGPNGSTPVEYRLSFWNRGAARAALRKALAWDPQRLIIAHGTCVHANGRAALERALVWIG